MSMRFEAGTITPGRAELASTAARLAADGMSSSQIAELLGCSPSYVRELRFDPDGAKARARKDSYRGTCEECGKPTNGGAGPGKAPKLCASCYTESVRAEHGTLSRYRSGCDCDDCRRANRERMAALKGKPAPTHGYSGYVNYGCRCDICTEATRVYGWMHPEYQKRWRAKREAEREATT